MKKLILAIAITVISTTVQASTYTAICEDSQGNQDLYVFDYTTESYQYIQDEIYAYCAGIGRLFVDIESISN